MSHPLSHPPTVCLSLATGPFLAALLAFRFLREGAIELGQTSEELWRGERLPLLNFPPSDSPDDHLSL